ncbi:bifunctional 3'-5' exonuclease/DNA polymerase [Rothia nasimurium]|uniref:DNA-directed DNA polymerase n=1 Tax=Rothia nasimurium TaxID=85336 RepID=A0A1Y1RPH6_9MICC|nr:bifunctional 3'-5' exonuclease/DNA polymerase [Rothia nasimurium]ORC16411.1 bifunctional 3'-5' exonuclease/DNA polymerase [Rothia nasimurium]
MYIVLGPANSPGSLPRWEAVTLNETGSGTHRVFDREKLPSFVRAVENQNPHRTIRWAWADARTVMPQLLEAGVSPASCHDLRLAQRILKTAASRAQNQLPYTPTVDLTQAPGPPPGVLPARLQIEGQASLFDGLAGPEPGASTRDTEPTASALLTELRAQLRAVTVSPAPARLQLLLAAESQGALIAAEMKHAGMPWNRTIHEKILEHELGPRPAGYARPYQMERLAARIREELGAPGLNPDSPHEVLKALQAAGHSVTSTRKWELTEWANAVPHLRETRWQLVRPLLDYKRLARLYTANGWNWLDTWVHNNRFHPTYEVGSAATGRWGGHGGGAMQIPKDVRPAIRAEEGMVLTVADAAQIEPRILAVMSGDRAMAVAGRGTDLYLGIAQIGERTGSVLNDRSHAKVALLGAMYGATTGEGGQLMPHLKKMFPAAIALTERAAEVGLRGGQVTTYLGRTSPAPSHAWFEAQRNQVTAADERAALSAARAHSRFTRNFVIQGTAAEWAVIWMAQIRKRLRTERRFGRRMQTRLVYFLHDEIMLYGPVGEAARAAEIVRESAQVAAELIFGPTEVEFPVTVVTTDDYSRAK